MSKTIAFSLEKKTLKRLCLVPSLCYMPKLFAMFMKRRNIHRGFLKGGLQWRIYMKNILVVIVLQIVSSNWKLHITVGGVLRRR